MAQQSASSAAVPPPSPPSTLIAVGMSPAASEPPPPAAISTPSPPLVTVLEPATQPSAPPTVTAPTEVAAAPPPTVTEIDIPPAAPPPPPAQPVAESPSEPASSGLSDIAAVVNALPTEGRAAASAAMPPRAAPVRTAEARRPNPRTPSPQSPNPKPANPARHWVQIAGGVDRASLPREFARLRAQAPIELGRRTAFTAPMRASSRLLVGPFASDGEAQDFVNQLARKNVTAFAWTSAAGQEIERLQTGR